MSGFLDDVIQQNREKGTAEPIRAEEGYKSGYDAVTTLQGQSGIERIEADLGDTRHFGEGRVYLTDDLEASRAANQTSMQKIGNAALKVLPGIALGLAETAGYLLDYENYGAMLSGTQTNYDNWLSNYTRELRKDLDEYAPVFQSEPGKAWNPSDVGWWANNIGGLAESVAEFFIIGAATGGGGVALGAGAKAGRALTLMKRAKLLKNMGTLSGANLAKAQSRLTRINSQVNLWNQAAQAGSAMDMGVALSSMNAVGTYEKMKQTALQSVNPKTGKRYNETEAEQIALNSAQSTFNHSLLFNSAMNFTSMSPFFRGKSVPPRAKIKAKAGESTDDLLTRYKQMRNNPEALDNGNKIMDRWYAETALEMGQEAVEEYGEALAGQIGENKGMAEVTGKSQSLNLLSEEMLAAAFMGALGGGLGTGFKKFFDRNNDSKIQESFTTELDARITQLENFKSNQQKLSKARQEGDEVAADEAETDLFVNSLMESIVTDTTDSFVAQMEDIAAMTEEQAKEMGFNVNPTAEGAAKSTDYRSRAERAIKLVNEGKSIAKAIQEDSSIPVGLKKHLMKAQLNAAFNDSIISGIHQDLAVLDSTVLNTTDRTSIEGTAPLAMGVMEAKLDALNSMVKYYEQNPNSTDPRHIAYLKKLQAAQQAQLDEQMEASAALGTPYERGAGRTMSDYLHRTQLYRELYSREAIAASSREDIAKMADPEYQEKIARYYEDLEKRPHYKGQLKEKVKTLVGKFYALGENGDPSIKQEIVDELKALAESGEFEALDIDPKFDTKAEVMQEVMESFASPEDLRSFFDEGMIGTVDPETQERIDDGTVTIFSPTVTDNGTRVETLQPEIVDEESRFKDRLYRNNLQEQTTLADLFSKIKGELTDTQQMFSLAERLDANSAFGDNPIQALINALEATYNEQKAALIEKNKTEVQAKIEEINAREDAEIEETVAAIYNYMSLDPNTVYDVQELRVIAEAEFEAMREEMMYRGMIGHEAWNRFIERINQQAAYIDERYDDLSIQEIFEGHPANNKEIVVEVLYKGKRGFIEYTDIGDRSAYVFIPETADAEAYLDGSLFDDINEMSKQGVEILGRDLVELTLVSEANMGVLMQERYPVKLNEVGGDILMTIGGTTFRMPPFSPEQSVVIEGETIKAINLIDDTGMEHIITDPVLAEDIGEIMLLTAMALDEYVEENRQVVVQDASGRNITYTVESYIPSAPGKSVIKTANGKEIAKSQDKLRRKDGELTLKGKVITQLLRGFRDSVITPLVDDINTQQYEINQQQAAQSAQTQRDQTATTTETDEAVDTLPQDVQQLKEQERKDNARRAEKIREYAKRYDHRIRQLIKSKDIEALKEKKQEFERMSRYAGESDEVIAQREAAKQIVKLINAAIKANSQGESAKDRGDAVANNTKQLSAKTKMHANSGSTSNEDTAAALYTNENDNSEKLLAPTEDLISDDLMLNTEALDMLSQEDLNNKPEGTMAAIESGPYTHIAKKTSKGWTPIATINNKTGGAAIIIKDKNKNASFVDKDGNVKKVPISKLDQNLTKGVEQTVPVAYEMTRDQATAVYRKIQQKLTKDDPVKQEAEATRKENLETVKEGSLGLTTLPGMLERSERKDSKGNTISETTVNTDNNGEPSIKIDSQFEHITQKGVQLMNNPAVTEKTHTVRFKVFPDGNSWWKSKGSKQHKGQEASFFPIYVELVDRKTGEATIVSMLNSATSGMGLSERKLIYDKLMAGETVTADINQRIFKTRNGKFNNVLNTRDAYGAPKFFPVFDPFNGLTSTWHHTENGPSKEDQQDKILILTTTGVTASKSVKEDGSRLTLSLDTNLGNFTQKEQAFIKSQLSQYQDLDKSFTEGQVFTAMLAPDGTLKVMPLSTANLSLEIVDDFLMGPLAKLDSNSISDAAFEEFEQNLNQVLATKQRPKKAVNENFFQIDRFEDGSGAAVIRYYDKTLASVVEVSLTNFSGKVDSYTGLVDAIQSGKATVTAHKVDVAFKNGNSSFTNKRKIELPVENVRTALATKKFNVNREQLNSKGGFEITNPTTGESQMFSSYNAFLIGMPDMANNPNALYNKQGGMGNGPSIVRHNMANVGGSVFVNSGINFKNLKASNKAISAPTTKVVAPKVDPQRVMRMLTIAAVNGTGLDQKDFSKTKQGTGISEVGVSPITYKDGMAVVDYPMSKIPAKALEKMKAAANKLGIGLKIEGITIIPAPTVTVSETTKDNPLAPPPVEPKNKPKGPAPTKPADLDAAKIGRKATVKLHSGKVDPKFISAEYGTGQSPKKAVDSTDTSFTVNIPASAMTEAANTALINFAKENNLDYYFGNELRHAREDVSEVPPIEPTSPTTPTAKKAIIEEYKEKWKAYIRDLIDPAGGMGATFEEVKASGYNPTYYGTGIKEVASAESEQAFNEAIAELEAELAGVDPDVLAAVKAFTQEQLNAIAEYNKKGDIKTQIDNFISTVNSVLGLNIVPRTPVYENRTLNLSINGIGFEVEAEALKAGGGVDFFGFSKETILGIIQANVLIQKETQGAIKPKVEDEVIVEDTVIDTSDLALDDLDLGLDLGDVTFKGKEKNNIKFRKASKAANKINIPKAKAWLEKRGIPFNEKKQIIHALEATNADETIHGYFTDGLVYLSSSAEVGTEYHEAFHAVFNMWTTDEQRVQILNEAKGKFRSPSASELAKIKEEVSEQLGREITNEEATDIFYEEVLAEKFREYTITNQKPRTIGESIWKFFKDIFNYLKTFMSKKRTINQLFSNIESGRIRKPRLKRQMPSGMKLFSKQGYNSKAVKNITNAINTKFVTKYDEYSKQGQVSASEVFLEIREDFLENAAHRLVPLSNPKNAKYDQFVNLATKVDMTPERLSLELGRVLMNMQEVFQSKDVLEGNDLIDAIKTSPVDPRVKKIAASWLEKTFNNGQPYFILPSIALAKQLFTDELAGKLEKGMQNAIAFLDINIGWNSRPLDENGLLIPEEGWRDLASKQLKTFGLTIKGSVLADDLAYDQERIHGKDSVEDNRTDRLSGKVKNLMSRLPRANAEPVLGIIPFVPFEEVAANVAQTMSEGVGITDASTMLDRLLEKAEKDPTYKTLYDELLKLAKSDSLEDHMLFNDFYKNMAMTYRNFHIFQEKSIKVPGEFGGWVDSGKYEITNFDANSQRLTNILMRRWQENSKRPNGIYNISSTGEMTVDNKKLASLEKAWDTISQVNSNEFQLKTKHLNALHTAFELLGVVIPKDKLLEGLGTGMRVGSTTLSSTELFRYLTRDLSATYKGSGRGLSQVIDRLKKPEANDIYGFEGNFFKKAAAFVAQYSNATNMSFMNGQGKIIYPVNMHTPLTRQLNALKYYGQNAEWDMWVDSLSNDPIYDYNGMYMSPILELVKNGKGNLIDYTTLDVYKRKNETISRNSFDQLSEVGEYLYRLNAFANNGDPNAMYITAPTLPDRKANILVKMPRMGALSGRHKWNKPYKDMFKAMLVQDLKAMQQAEAFIGDKIKNQDSDGLVMFYHYNIDKKTGKMVPGNYQEFSQLAFLNNTAVGRELKKVFGNNSEEQFLTNLSSKATHLVKRAMEEVDNYIEKQVETMKSELELLGINKTVETLDQTGRPIRTELKNPIDLSLWKNDINAFARDYVISNIIAVNDIRKLTAGERLMAKNYENYSKRYRGYMTPGLESMIAGEELADGFVLEHGDMKEYSMAIVEDVFSTKESYEAMASLKDLALDNENAKRLSELLEKTYGEGKSNKTDAMGYTTIHKHRAKMMGQGIWSNDHEAAYNNYVNGKEFAVYELDGKTVKKRPLLQPLKTYHDALYEYGGKQTRVLVKHSTFPLLREFTKNSPRFEALRQRMEAEGKYSNLEPIDEVNQVSAIKVGAVNVNDTVAMVDADGNPDFSQMKAMPFKLATRNQRIPQTIPTRVKASKIGSQLMKLAPAALSKFADTDYTLANGSKIKGRELFNKYQEVLQEMQKREQQKLYKRLGYSGKDMNPKQQIKFLKKLRRLLTNVVNERGLSSNYLKALDIVPAEDGGYTYNVPLTHPAFGYKFEQMMVSLFKNGPLNLTINGKAFVQIAEFGTHQKDGSLKFIHTKDGKTIEAAEIAIPYEAAEKMGLPKDENGDFDLSKVDPRILTLTGYRIPTQGKSTMLPLKIKRILPKSMGKVVLVPGEITAQMGSDFDVDKLFTMMPNFSMQYPSTKGGRPYDLYADFSKKLDKVIGEELNLTSAQIRDLWGDDRVIEDIFNDGDIDKEMSDKELYDAVKEARERVEKTMGSLGIDSKTAKPVATYLPYNQEQVGQSTSAGLENMFIELTNAILQNPVHLVDMLSPVDSDTAANLKEIMSQMIDNDPSLLENLDPTDYRTEMLLSLRSKVGEKGIGYYATHMTGAAVAEHTETGLKPKYGIKVGKKNFTSLNKVEDANGVSVIYSFSKHLTMAVDNANDPIMGFLNDNLFTAPITALFIRAGVTHPPLAKALAKKLGKSPEELDFDGGPVEVATVLRMQPAVKALTRHYLNNDYMPSDLVRAIKEVVVQMGYSEKAASEFIGKKVKKGSTQAFNPTTLLDDIGKEFNVKDTKFMTRQLQALANFYHFHKGGSEMHKVNKTFFNTDVLKNGLSNVAGYRAIQDSRKALITKLMLGSNYTENFAGVLSDNSPYPIAKSYDDTYIEMLDFMSRFFAYASDSFNGVIANVKGLTGKEELNENQHQMLNRFTTSYLLSLPGSPARYAFKPEVYVPLLYKKIDGVDNTNSIVDRLNKVKDRIISGELDLADNQFLNSVDVHPDNHNAATNILALKFNTNGSLNQFEQDQLIDEFDELLEHSDAMVVSLAEDLITYNLVAKGLQSGVDSFADMIPVDQMSRFSDYISNKTRSAFSETVRTMGTKFIENNSHIPGLIQFTRADNIESVDVDTFKLNEEALAAYGDKGPPAYLKMFVQGEATLFKALETDETMFSKVEYVNGVKTTMPVKKGETYKLLEMIDSSELLNQHAAIQQEVKDNSSCNLQN